MKNKQRIIIVSAVILIISIVLRLYQIAALTDWSGDSGGDLLIARNILFFGHRPLVGTFLTVENIFLPPLYFYLLAGMLWVVQTPIGIIGFFFVLNMVFGVVLGLLAGKMVDPVAGVIAFAMFAFSSVFIEHGRSFYHPYMLEPFFVVFLYLFWIAMRGKQQVYLVFALLSLSIAAAIYPSPWLLLPYMIYLLYRYLLLQPMFHNRIKAFIGAVFMLGVGSIPIYIPWYVHEMRYGFPAFLSVVKNDFGGISGISRWPQQYAIYLYELVNQFTGIGSIFPAPLSYYAAGVFAIILAAISMQIPMVMRSFSKERASVYSNAFLFVDVKWFLISFIPMIIFWENAYHRLWVYLPIIFLIMTMVIRLAIESRNVWLKTCVGFLIAFFIAGNASANWDRVTASPKNSLGNTEQTALRIISDVHNRGVTGHDYQVLYYTPYGYGNYNLSTILYFLQLYDGYPVRFLTHGNDIERYTINTPHTAAVYLICRWDIPARESMQKCNDIFLAQNSIYSLALIADVPLGKMFVYIQAN